MSTNLHIVATRDIKVLKTGQITQQEIYYKDVWQTPTEVTRNIINDPDPINAYKEWVMIISPDKTRLVYDEDDIFNEGEPIGHEIYNEGRDHIVDFNEWLEFVEQSGYDVKCEAW